MSLFQEYYFILRLFSLGQNYPGEEEWPERIQNMETFSACFWLLLQALELLAF